VQRFTHGLDVDPCIGWKDHAKLRPALEREQPAELREESRQRGVRCTWQVVVPERVDELVAADRAAALEHEKGEEETALAPREALLCAMAIDLDPESAAEEDARRQAVAKVTTTLALILRSMAKILVNVTNGPEHPTTAALAFLVARAAQDAGHEVSLFLAGDAVQLLREPVLDSLVGLGTGSLRESHDALRAGGARWYVSGMSSKARGFEPDGLAEAALPSRLVELSLDADRVLTY
jgi:predicted peroxiredoxin